MTQLWRKSPGYEDDIVSICHMGLVTATLLCNIVTWVCLNALSSNLGGQIPVKLTKKNMESA